MKRMTLFPLALAAALPIAVHADCSERDLKGRWNTVGLVESGVFASNWEHCSLRITARGRATGNCVYGDGHSDPADPIQFTVSQDCRFTGTSETGEYSYSGKIQRSKGGMFGTFNYQSELDPTSFILFSRYIAVKR